MPRDTPTTEHSVVIIGAGACGLAAANAVQAKGIPARIVERTDRVGDAWYHRHPQLQLNTHRHLSGLPGLAIPKAAGAFPSRDSVIQYLDEYANRLEAPIDSGVEVNRIDQSENGWILDTSAGVYRTRHVIVATGHSRVPKLPNWPGSESFEKPLIHATDFGDLQSYRNKKILVVGAGNSGTDILNHLATIETDKVWVSVRHGPVIFPFRLWGVPMQRLSPLFAAMPAGLADTMLALTEYLAFGNLKKWGLPKHPQGGISRMLKTGTAPAVDNGFVASLKAGDVAIVPEIECFERSSVRLVNCQIIEPDVVVAATGYRTGLETILGHIDVLDRSGNPKIRGAQQIDHYRGLWFTGMEPRLTGYFQLAASDGRNIAAGIERQLKHSIDQTGYQLQPS